MKSTIIPPIKHLELAKGRDYHLILAHLVELSSDYREFYKSESENGSHIILDNSAHEFKVGQPIQRLLELAPQVGASEIVIPDKLFDGLATSTMALNSFLELTKSLYPYHWMLVPQGKDEEDFSACLHTLGLVIEMVRRESPLLLSKGITLGVSKDYEIFDGGLYRIIKDYVIPWADYYHADIHLLGWGRDLWAYKKIAEDFGGRIRSIDSAKPLVYATSQIALDPVTSVVPEYPRRPENYFHYEFTPEGLEIARHNTSIFDSITNGVV